MLPRGTFVFPMAQAGANLLVAALEPESAAGFVALAWCRRPARHRKPAGSGAGGAADLPPDAARRVTEPAGAQVRRYFAARSGRSVAVHFVSLPAP